MTRAQELGTLASQLENGLAGDEGVAEKIPPLVRAARELAALDSAAAPLAQRLEAAVVELQELGGDFGRLGAGLDFDEETTRALQERMSLWLELQRRLWHRPCGVARQTRGTGAKSRCAIRHRGHACETRRGISGTRKSPAPRRREIERGPDSRRRIAREKGRAAFKVTWLQTGRFANHRDGHWRIARARRQPG